MPWWNLPADAEVDWLTWANAVPLCRDLGLVCRELESTSAVFRMERPPLTPNPNGAASGAIVAAAADWVMGAFVRRISDHDQLPGTSSLHIQFHLPALAPLTFRVAPLGGGRRTKFVEVVVEDRDGNRCATSQATIIAGGSPTGPLPNG
jgi:acyl-coenzyme A thioesterase PaaI-like protein